MICEGCKNHKYSIDDHDFVCAKGRSMTGWWIALNMDDDDTWGRCADFEDDLRQNSYDKLP